MLAQWRARCYVPAPFDDLLADPQRSVVVISHAGCGLTTSFRLLQDEPLLLFDYPVRQWPEQRDAFNSRPDHFGQWMGHVAYAFEQQLRERPERIQQLRPYHYEFLAWLTRSYLGQRHVLSLVRLLERHLPAEQVRPLQRFADEAEPSALFRDNVSGTLGQIGEALDIADELGFNGIFACVELPATAWIKTLPAERERIQRQLHDLLAALTPLSRPGFGIKVGIPDIIMRPDEARSIVRDRAIVTVAYWDSDLLLELAGRLGAAALPDGADNQKALTAPLLIALQADIAAVYGKPGPAAVQIIAQALAEMDPRQTEESMLHQLRLRLYLHGGLLRIDGDPNTRRIWRGAKPITLSDNHFELFELLWRHRGDYVKPDTLLSIGSTKSNVDQLVARLRKQIEPPLGSDDRIYICRDRSGARLRRESCDFA